MRPGVTVGAGSRNKIGNSDFYPVSETVVRRLLIWLTNHSPVGADETTVPGVPLLTSEGRLRSVLPQDVDGHYTRTSG